MSFEALKDEVRDAIENGIAGLSGEAGKEKLLAAELAQALARYAGEGNQEAIDFTIARARLLGERMRLEATEQFWTAVERVVRAVAAFALRVG